jgi:hypothetical protein
MSTTLLFTERHDLALRDESHKKPAEGALKIKPRTNP